MKRIAYYVVFVWFLTQTSLGNQCCFADDTATGEGPAVSKNDLKIDEIYLVFDEGGSRRIAPFATGETIPFAVRFSGLDVLTEKKYPYCMTYWISDTSGKRIQGPINIIYPHLLPLGGDAYTFYFSLVKPIPPGQYTVTCQVALGGSDHDTKPIGAEKKFVFNVVEQPRLYLEKAGVYHDREFQCLTRGNFTLGDFIHAQYILRVPESKKDELRPEATITVYDRQNREVNQQPCDIDVQRNGTRCSFRVHYFPTEAGFYRINLEIKDPVTNQVDKFDLPVAVHPPLGIPNAAMPATAEPRPSEEKAGASSKADDNPPLTIEAYRTLDTLGGPHAETYLAHEEKRFLLRFRGLTGNQGYADVEISNSVLDSASKPLEGEGKQPGDSTNGLPITEQGACLLPVELRKQVAPGDYKVRWSVKDNLTKKTASTDVPITVLSSDTFALGGVGLWSDTKRKTWTGANLSVGEVVYVGGKVFLPKQSNGHLVQLKLSFLDANRKELTIRPLESIEVPPVDVSPNGLNVIVPTVVKFFCPNRPGSFIACLEIKDQTTNEVATKEIPFNVFEPPELPEVSETNVSVTGLKSLSDGK